MTKQHLPMLLALAILAGCSAQDKPDTPATPQKATTAQELATPAPVAVIVDVPAKPTVAPAVPHVVAPKPKVHKNGSAAPELSAEELAKLKASLNG
jgi:hypothetical protein